MPNLKIAEVLSVLESRAPSGAAEEWDNVGLLVGDPQWRTSGAIVTIDLSTEALRLALKKKYRLIVTHHPCIFPKSRGLSRVVAAENGGMRSLVFEALRAGVAVAACHTNFDQCALEVVEKVSAGLGVVPRARLLDKADGALLKLAVFVPKTHVEQVRDALCEAGAGHIGNYDFCTFGTEGEGTFRGNAQSNPFLGRPGKLERAAELRLETVFPRSLSRAVIGALLASHPYEEVAYDLYPVEQRPSPLGMVKGLGYGFWGEFNSLKPFSEVLENVKRLFNVDGYWLTDPPPSRIRKIGFAAGKGSSFLEPALSAGCDLFITGEAGYHPAVESARKGMAVLELGHRESECFFAPTVQGWLREAGLKTMGLERITQRVWSMKTR